MIKIFKEFTFEAAHFLPTVPEGHKCRNLHGHSYKLKVWLHGPVDVKLGWVMDFSDLKNTVSEIINVLDHTCLNEIPGLENPTCEILASWLWEKLSPKLSGLYELHLNETETSGCVYSGFLKAL